jgi:hypothetical protein
VSLLNRIRWWFSPGPTIYDLYAEVLEQRTLAILAVETARTNDPWTAARNLYGGRS